MTESRLSAADTARTAGGGPGTGWVAFAGVMLLLTGAFNVVVGLVALFRSDLFVAAPAGALVVSLTGSGWSIWSAGPCW